MKVGIISKEDHAKSHAAALEEAGFLPVMLGSSPSEIPPTVPIVVCRTLSCSHGGMDTALAWSRAGKGRLIVENGVKTIVSKALRIRSEVGAAPIPVEGDAAPVRMSYEDLQEAAQVLADTRPDDTYEVLVSVLHRMYPNEEVSLLRAVAASVRSPTPEAPIEISEPVLPEPAEIPVVELSAPPTSETLPMPVEAAPVVKSSPKKPYPKRFADRLTEAEVEARMEKAWDVRGEMTDEQAAAVGKWASKGAVGRVPHVEHLRKFDRNPLAFAGLLLLCAEKPLVRRDITRAYDAVTKKKFFALMADIAAWSLDMKLEVATNAIPKKAKPAAPVTPTPTEEPSVPVAPPITLPPAAPVPATEDSTLTLLKALSASLDALLAKVEEIDGRVGELTTRIEKMTHTSVAPAPIPSTSSTGDALAALAAKGLEVVVRPSSR